MTQTAMEKAQQPAAPIALAEKPNSLARIDLRELKQIAEIMVASGAFNDIKQVAQAQVKIMAGAELGFSPIVSMTGIHFFQGKVTVGANLQASLIKESKKYDYDVVEHTGEACAVQFYELTGSVSNPTRRPLGPPVRYTITEAATAGLTGKDVWKKFPGDMLFAACIRQGTRRYCADVLRGVTAETDTTADFEEAPAPLQETQPTYETTDDGDKVDVLTGEVIDQTDPFELTPTEETAVLGEINNLLFTKCGDGETIDLDEAKKFLKGRDPSVMPLAALVKLRDELAAM